MKNVCLIFCLCLSLPIFANTLDWSVDELSEYLGYRNYDELTVLSEDEEYALLSYAFTDEVVYEDINGYLREGASYDFYNQTVEGVKALVKDIKSAAKKAPRIPKGLVVYRGFKLSWRKDKCFKKGDVILDKALLSTTLRKKTAEHFAFRKESGKGAFVTIKLTQDTEGILITENREEEVLFMPSTKIIVTDAYEKDGNCYVQASI